MKHKVYSIMIMAGILLLLSSSVYAKKHSHRHSYPPDVYIFSESDRYKYDDREYHYGRSKKSRYGEKRSVTTEDEAQGIVRDYFPNRKMRTGKMRNKKLYFETDILDDKGNIVDRVIIDKRSGRIRSVY